MAHTIWENGKLRDATAEEETSINSERASAPSSKDKKLINIKQLRLQKLIETDYLAMSDNVMSDDMKNFRKSMRDIPQDFTTEEQYDLLLARNEETGELTHSVWSKP